MGLYRGSKIVLQGAAPGTVLEDVAVRETRALAVTKGLGAREGI